jgi:hypothetical protein
LLEYILSLKTENWSTVLGSNFPSNLVTLLEAFIHKKDTYEVKCTPKGKKVAKEIIEELFHNNSNLKSILANLEIEDFPKQDFPYENPSYWGFPRLTAVFEKKKWVMERDLELTTEDWWTDNLGYLKKVID